MKSLSRQVVLLSSVAMLGVLSSSGCTKLETGAHAEPSVRIKLAESSSGDGKGGTGVEKADTTAVAAASGGPGNITGKVIFKGNAPATKLIYAKGKAEKDGQVCSASGDIPDESLLVSSDGGIANVFIYLDKAPAGFKAAPPADALSFDQKNCIFTTHAMICQIGQPVKVMNDDGIVHNTHTFPGKNDQFNSSVKANEREGIPLVYKKAEKVPFQVKCDFHSWMIAFHLPLDHPFGAVTDKSGQFKIENLPAGSYQFKVWHEKADGGKGGFLESKLKVTVKPGDNEPLSISVDAAKLGL